MAERRGYSSSIVLMLLFSILRLKSVLADTYTVGDAFGWSSALAVASWPDGKIFKAYDTLVFNYIPGFHSVVVVDENGYDFCNPLLGNRGVYLSGADNIVLSEGMNYFIDGIYCLSGMRMAVLAT